MPPSLVLSLLLASFYGFLGHGIFGRRRAAIGLYWVAALVGFAAGYWVTLVLGANLPRVGETPVIEGSIGAVVAVAAARLSGL